MSRSYSLSRFTDQARRVIVLAQEQAWARQDNYIGTEHLLLALTSDEESPAAKVLQEMNVSIENVKAAADEIVAAFRDIVPLPVPMEPYLSGPIPFAPRARRVLEFSLREALLLDHNQVKPEHILLGSLRERDGVAAQALERFGGDLGRFREPVIRMGRERGQPQAKQKADIPKELDLIRVVLERCVYADDIKDGLEQLKVTIEENAGSDGGEV